MRRTLFFLILLCLFLGFGNYSKGEQSTIDSLKNELVIEETDTNKVKLLLLLFWEYRRIDTDIALEYASQSLELSKKNSYRPGIGKSLYSLGVIQKSIGNYTDALEYYSKSLRVFSDIKDSASITSCLTEHGAIYKMKNNYRQALVYLLQAQQIASNCGFKNSLSQIYNRIGNIYYSQKQHDKALDYFNKSLTISKELGFELGMSVVYNNIGNVYNRMALYDKAIDSYKQSLEIKQRINDKLGILKIYNNLGLPYIELGNFEKAFDYHSKALKISKELNRTQDILKCLTNIGYDYLKDKQFKNAIEYANQVIGLSKDIEIIDYKMEAYRILAESYENLNEFKDAYYFFRLYSSYKDTLSDKKIISTIAKMETGFELEKKEKEIALLNSKKEKQELLMQKKQLQQNLLIGLILLIVIVLIFLYLGYRNKQKLNKKLKDLNLTKSRFFANISHEFRTPLSLLLGPLEKLLQKPEQEEKEMIGMMHSNASRLLILNNQLMDLSKLEAGKLIIKVFNSEITQVLKGMVMSFLSLADKKEIDFKCIFPNEEIQAYFDQDKIEKIVYNLLSNAIKFTPENGKVIFRLSLISGNTKRGISPKIRKLKGKVLCISVSDTGTGIAKEHLPYIFDRFYQVDSGPNRNFEGTGIGLSLTKELIDLCHGELSVTSETGKGSSFSVYLPIDKIDFETNEIDNSTEVPVETSVFTDTFQTEGKFKKQDIEEITNTVQTEEVQHILIVEDNPDMRNYIRDCFEGKFKIEEANNGESGFETASAEIPDVIISDLMMPKMDGLEMCQKLKTDERTSHIPVILLTALVSVEDRISGLESGADDYIAKPFNRQELIARVHNLTEQRKILRERFGKEIKIQPKDIAIVSADEKFLTKLISFIENNISKEDLNVDSLTREIHLSRSQLHRKLTALTGLSATEFIRNIRLKRAAQLLEQHNGTIAETSYDVGFNSVSYFSRCFQKQFGVSPTEYIKQA